MKQQGSMVSVKIIGFLYALILSASVFAQNSPVQERTFHASESAVRQALQENRARTGGKLPTLEGFVNESGSLNSYRRGYYQYDLTVTPVDSTTTKVRVTAKITAWYNGQGSEAGYKVLPSNGRLESDLLDNLDESLKPADAANSSPAHTDVIAGPPAPPTAPDTPSAQQPKSVFRKALNDAPASPSAKSSGSGDEATEKRVQQLINEGNSYREILRNQSRPSNLAVIKEAKTAIVDRPTESAKVVLVADAQDEFQVVDMTGDWVHIQVSGLSRGWVRRTQVEVPSAIKADLATLEQDPRSFDRAPTFQQTREEVAVFPGKWEPLDGKKVKIIWVQPSDKKSFGSEPKLNLVKTVLRKSFGDVAGASPSVAGVVVILDSEDGGMAAATMAALQQWHAGHLPDVAFWKRCLLDPAEAFKSAD